MSDDNDLVAQANRVLAMERERRMAAVPQQFMVIKNNNAEGDICFNEHVIKPGEELRLPMAPLPPVGWNGTLNDLVAAAPKKTLALENFTDTDFERLMRDANPDWSNKQEPLKRIDKIAKY